MATTSPDNIETPDPGDGFNYISDLNVLADTVQQAITNQSSRFPTNVANQAARDSIFPSPVQGNRVFRNDLGYEQVYFGLYNATTNPQGASAAGWYPYNRAFVATRTSTQSLTSGWNVLGSALTQSRNDGLGTLSSAGAFTVTTPGWYRIHARYQLTNNSAPAALQIVKNTATPDTANTLSGFLITNTASGGDSTTVSQLAAGDVIRILVYTLSANTIDTAGTRGGGFSIEKL